MVSMEERADEAASFVGGLASAHRLRILCRLSEGERSVSELVDETGLAQTSMSQHLARLKAEGIVDFRREHRVLYYFISSAAALQVMQVLHGQFCTRKGKTR